MTITEKNEYIVAYFIGFFSKHYAHLDIVSHSIPE
jgi:hypothetical protein